MNLFDIAIARKLSGGGGGGSSDFTTAEVTIVNNSNDFFEIPLCYTHTDPLLGNTLKTSIKVEAGDSEIVNAVLYKNHYAFILPAFNASCTGGITYSFGIFEFTGDGTITIS